MNTFWGTKILLLFFFFWGGGGSSLNWTSFRVISMYFRAFLKVNIQNKDSFGVAKNSNIFWGVDIPDIFWG